MPVGQTVLETVTKTLKHTHTEKERERGGGGGDIRRKKQKERKVNIFSIYTAASRNSIFSCSLKRRRCTVQWHRLSETRKEPIYTKRGLQQAFNFPPTPEPSRPPAFIGFPSCTPDRAPCRVHSAGDLITCVRSIPHNNGPSAGSCKYVAVRYKLPVPHLHPLPDLYVSSFDKSRCLEGVGVRWVIFRVALH